MSSTFIDLSDTPSNYEDGKYVVSTDSGLSYTELNIAGLELLQTDVGTPTQVSSNAIFAPSPSNYVNEAVAFCGAFNNKVSLVMKYNGSFYEQDNIGQLDTSLSLPDDFINLCTCQILDFDGTKYYIGLAYIDNNYHVQFEVWSFDTSNNSFSQESTLTIDSASTGITEVASYLPDTSFMGVIYLTDSNIKAVFVDCSNPGSPVVDQSWDYPEIGDTLSVSPLALDQAAIVYYGQKLQVVTLYEGFSDSVYYITCDLAVAVGIDRAFSVVLYGYMDEYYVGILNHIVGLMVSVPGYLGQITTTYRKQIDISYRVDSKEAVVIIGNQSWSLKFTGLLFTVDKSIVTTVPDWCFTRSLYQPDIDFMSVGYDDTNSDLEEVQLACEVA